MVNQPSQTKNSDTIKISTLATSQLLILNTVTPTLQASQPINYPDQLDRYYDYLELKNCQNMIYSDMSKENAFRGFLPLESESRAETVSTMRGIGEELNTPVISEYQNFCLFKKNLLHQTLYNHSRNRCRLKVFFSE